MKPADRQESPGEDVGSDAPDWGFFSAVDLTHGEQHFPRKRYIEVEYPTIIGKRVRGVNGRAVVSNKKFDCYKRCLVDDKDDFDFVCTTEERHIMLRILSAKPTEKIIHINDVVLTKADFECLLQAYPYDHYEKNISTKAYLENPSVVPMLINYGYYDGVKLGNTNQNMYKSAAVNYVNNDMIFLPIRTSIGRWYLGVLDCTRKEVCVLDSMDTTEDDLKELKFLMKGIRKCVRLVLDEKIVENPRTSSGLYIIKFMELWTGDSLSKQFYQHNQHFEQNEPHSNSIYLSSSSTVLAAAISAATAVQFQQQQQHSSLSSGITVQFHSSNSSSVSFQQQQSSSSSSTISSSSSTTK
ncbi:hypothetical protein OsI_12702 [Oryza sativa Indica Group]|uniref:Ubiquitin-like protease family profile domain-containing protein n=1 Tax=Oryza sativa subsp. indica TaxID=39946 RepID=B8AN13_ORYSI|nr:hypothetical protein OsI_12702 [Oryza sativa Indica Group]